MLNVYRSNRLENLVDALAEVLRTPLASPFDIEWIAVSSQAMRTWLARELARRFGVFAGARFPFPREMMERILGAREAEPDGPPLMDQQRLCFAILALLPELLPRPEFTELRRYLDDDPHQQKRVQAASRIAHAFDEYALYRPDMVLSWERGNEDHWQARLWRHLKQRYEFRHIAEIALGRAGDGAVSDTFEGGFRRVSFFAASLLPPLYFRVLSSLSEEMEIHLFAVSPSREWWADVKTRARPALTVDVNEHPELERLDIGNPILASLGRQARDFQWILEASTAYNEAGGDRYTDPATKRSSLLADVQSDILNLRYPRPPEAGRRGDGSIRVVSCHSRLREIEVLKDQLLDIFDASGGAVGPDDVAVLALDIEGYVPFIEAVFASEGQRIPFTVATRSHGRRKEVAGALGRLLDVCRGRMTVHEVFDLLTTRSIRDRFGLDEDAVSETRQWIVDAGVRWGMDRDHRRTLDQPDQVENTWRFGLDRLLLGIALSTEGLERFRGVSPARDLDAQAWESLGKLTAFVETLFENARRLAAPRPVPEWISEIARLMQEMIERADAVEGEYRAVSSALLDLAREAEAAGFGEPLDFVSMKHLVEVRLFELAAEAIWHPGGVAFSSLLPMRSLPFAVVCLLGMNEMEFPRTRSAPAFDLMAAHPRIGDRSMRSDDRHLFLEAVLQARRVLVISALGQSIKDGSAHPPSVLVRDLVETLVSLYGVERGDLVTEHPLQPFSPRYFGAAPETALFSFSRTHCEAAAAVLPGARAESRLFRAPATKSREPLALDIDELGEFFRLPARYLLKRRLNAAFPWREAAVLDREPLEPGGPDDRRARDWILDLLLRGSKGDALDLLRSTGLLPPGRAGVIRVQRLLRESEDLAKAVQTAREGPRAEPVELDLVIETDLGSTRLGGAVGDLWQSGLVMYAPRPLTGTAVLGAWIRHLALLAADAMPGLPETRLFGVKSRREVERMTLAAPPDGAMRHLGELIDLYRLGNEIPLPLMPDVSYKHALKMLTRNKRQGPAADLRTEWERSRYSRDIAVVTAFRGNDLFTWEPVPGAGFDSLSVRVFQPILEALLK